MSGFSNSDSNPSDQRVVTWCVRCCCSTNNGRNFSICIEDQSLGDPYVLGEVCFRRGGSRRLWRVPQRLLVIVWSRWMVNVHRPVPPDAMAQSGPAIMPPSFLIATGVPSATASTQLLPGSQFTTMQPANLAMLAPTSGRETHRRRRQA